MAQASRIPLVRRLGDFIDCHILVALSSLLFAAGSALAAAAPSINTVILGRVVAGVGGSLMLQSTGIFLNPFTTVAERSGYQAGVGLFWILGMLLGPILSAAFASNPATTWRWAFYILIPFMAGIALPTAVFVLPRPPKTECHSRKSLIQNLATIDWVGALLILASVVFWDFMTISSGTLWPWYSGASISGWVIVGVVVVTLILQQSFSLFTTPENRIIPVDLFANRTVLLICISTVMMATTYSIGLYCESALGTATHILPYLGTFIGTVLIAGVLLPVIRRYAAMYMTAGIFMVGASGYLVTITPSSPDANIMGCTAILGAATAICWPIGLSVNIFILPKSRAADATMLNNLLLSGPSAVILGMAAYDEVLQALAGLSSPILLDGGPQAAIAVEVLTSVIQRILYILLAAGAILVIAAACMKWESLDFKGSKGSGEDVVDGADTN
ncbi:major facilitator superfamily domain-containing protein [Xylariales sp. PMI_506]|nr:major facilitator superfamily domain-containing protein [Xylariales sp. PMI_506]